MRDIWGSRGRIPYAEYARRFHKIRDKQGNIRAFIPNAQQNAVRAAKRQAITDGRRARFLITKARQLGLSTQEISLSDYLCGTYTGMYILSVAHNMETTLLLFHIQLRFYEYLSTPELCEQGTKTPLFHWERASTNRREMKYISQDSFHFIGTAGTDSLAHGTTIQRAHLSEAARYPPGAFENILEGLQGVPRDGEIVAETTPNGAVGRYYDLAMQAILEPNRGPWVHVGLLWFDYFEYSEPTTTDEAMQILAEVATGTHAKFGAEEQAMAQRLAAEGHPMLTASQWKWRRTTRESLGQKFFQSYPEDMITCWLSTGRPFFDGFKLASIASGVVIEKHEGESCWIYELPIPGRDYVVWADPAQGIERGIDNDDGDAVQRANTGITDYSAWGIIDREVNSDVCVSLSRITPLELSRQLAKWGHIFNDALICVERNNHGAAVLLGLSEIEMYPAIYHHSDRMNEDGVEEKRAGFPTTTANRSLILDELDEEIRAGSYVPIDPRMRAQMSRFIVDERGKATAGPGAHDDLILGRAIGSFVVRMPRNFAFAMIG